MVTVCALWGGIVSYVTSNGVSNVVCEYITVKMSGVNKPKRKITEVPLHIKLNALSELEKGTPTQVVAQELGVHVMTVNGWIKKKRNYASGRVIIMVCFQLKESV